MKTTGTRPVVRPCSSISSARRWWVSGLALAAAIGLAPGLTAGKVTATRGQITLPTYPWWPAVRHPYFRGTDDDNIYPYPMLDQLSRQKENRTWQTVVLENDYLRLTFLPELGGRVYEVIDKTVNQPMFYVNHVVKPGLIGQCGAWISGGIEFNTGPQGHTVSAVQPVEVQILPPAPDGSRSVAVGEVERVYRTRWTVVVTLRPDRSYLEESVRIYNQVETVRPYYFWNCTAVPNPPGFRFIYPMTLGTDHGGTAFYTWPISDGKDLSRGTNYQDASSIFAYQCDQDFFGSYDEGADRGVVAYANHHQLPGKKAWTWGQGSYGTMHQMDLTDQDGPYNEVQTGPLPTQADVGRLEPHEAVGWQEWWYPLHGLGGFTFANRDVAVQASVETNGLRLRALGSGTWSPVTVLLRRGKSTVASGECRLSPRAPADLKLKVTDPTVPCDVEFKAGEVSLARFQVPLALPKRTPPSKQDSQRTARELAQGGWQEFLFARFPEAEAKFDQALAQEPKLSSALAGLAYVNLDRDPAEAAARASAAVAADPDNGLAHFALGVARYRLGDETAAAEAAWRAALDPAMAAPARALVAKLHLRRGQFAQAVRVLEEPGPWQADPVCRHRWALALHELGQDTPAAQLARQNLVDDPLDVFARSLLWLIGREVPGLELSWLAKGKTQSVLDLAAEYTELNQEPVALRLLMEFYCEVAPPLRREPIPFYWAAYLTSRPAGLARPTEQTSARLLRLANDLTADGVFPHHREAVPVLRWALAQSPSDGKAALYLGHLLFSMGQHAEGRKLWKQAGELGAAPAVAYRALGQATLHLDHDAQAAAAFLAKANAADPTDPIVARDLARVLFTQADKEPAAKAKTNLITRVREVLQTAYPAGKGRSDFVALLARAHNRLGRFAESAKMLDEVRITIWEGAREAHDLFEEAHLALGQAHLAAGRPAEALAEFNRALEYPENLATGKLEHTRVAHIHYLRGKALAAKGQQPAALEAWQLAANEPASTDPQKEEARKQAKAALDQAKEAPAEGAVTPEKPAKPETKTPLEKKGEEK